MASSYCLPFELYREIVCEVTDKRDLVPLLTASRALCYEAARILYRHVDLMLSSNIDERNYKLISQYSRMHFGSHVHSLRIIVSISSNFILYQEPLDILGPSLVLDILESVENLKALFIYFNPPFDKPRQDPESSTTHCFARTVCTKFLPENPPFQLHTLGIDLGGDKRFQSFLESQRELATFSWNIPAVLPTLSFFHSLHLPPTLSTLSTDAIEVVTLLPGSDIQRFAYHGNKEVRPEKSVPSVRSFYTGGLNRPQREPLCEMFPNLRYLEGECYGPQIMSTRGLIHLQKIKMHPINSTLPIDIYSDYVAQLFASNDAIQTVEICLAYKGLPDQVWTFERGLEWDNGGRVVEEKRIDKNEWMEW